MADLPSRYDPLFPFADPSRLIRNQLRRMQRLMGGDPFADIFEPLNVRLEAPAVFSPEFDVCETDDRICISVDVPGVKLEDIDIDVSARRLRISGRREIERRDERENWYAVERSYGSFNRSFLLPEGVDLDNVKAELNNGVLNVTVPKAEVSAPRRRIEISAEQRQLEQQAQQPEQQQGVKEPAQQKEKVQA